VNYTVGSQRARRGEGLRAGTARPEGCPGGRCNQFTKNIRKRINVGARIHPDCASGRWHLKTSAMAENAHP